MAKKQNVEFDLPDDEVQDEVDPFGNPSANENGEFEIDLSQADNRIPEGEYVGKVTDVQQAKSKNGNPQFVWGLMVTEGDYTGKQFKLYTAITPAALWKVAETLRNLGIDGEGSSVVKFKAKDVIGRGCLIQVRDNMQNPNNPQSMATGVLPHPKGTGYRYHS